MIDMREAELDTAGRQRICGDRQMYLLLYIYRGKQQQMQEKEQYEHQTDLMSLYGLDGDRSYPTLHPAELTSWLGQR